MTSIPANAAPPQPASTLKGLSLYGLVQVANGLAPLLTVPIFARAIGPDDYGVWDMLGAAMAIGIMLGNWGLPAAYTRFYFAYVNDAQRQQRLLGTLVGFTSLCLIAVCGLFYALGEPLTRLAGVPAFWSPLLMLVIVFGSLRCLEEFFLLYFRNSGQAAAYAQWDLLRLVLQTALSLVLVLAFGLGVYALALSCMAAYAAVLAVLIWRMGLRTCLAIDTAILRECLAFGWPLMTKIVMSVLSLVISRGMLTYITGGTASQGILGRANGLANMVFMFMVAAENIYSPRWNHVLFQTGQTGKSLGRLFTEHAAISSYMALGLILLGQEFVSLILPPAYAGAQSLVIVLALYYALLAFQQVQGAALHYLKMTKSQMACVFGSYVALVALNLVLIPRWEAMGAALGTLASGVLTIAAFELLLVKRYRIGYEGRKLLFLYGSLVVCSGVAMACTAGWVDYWAGLATRLALLAGLSLGWAGVLGWATVANVAGRLWCRMART
ncbi:MAG: oligosaccharide flippase family protein [Planctomycetaceae bacterium]|nr:oligosaccharide flippase family protein [Planctomycetaceae bacterium]